MSNQIVIRTRIGQFSFLLNSAGWAELCAWEQSENATCTGVLFADGKDVGFSEIEWAETENVRGALIQSISRVLQSSLLSADPLASDCEMSVFFLVPAVLAESGKCFSSFTALVQEASYRAHRFHQNA